MKNRIKFELFKNINDKEIAYILGLLWADGHVSFANNKSKTPIVKHTSKNDDNETFKKILNFSGNWNTFNYKNVGSYAKIPKTISVNWVSSRILGEFLIENDYRNKTNSPDLILNKIPQELKKYWFVGFFDGDGSVTIKNKGHHSIAFTGNKVQDWSFVSNLFNNIGIKKYKIRIVKSRGGESSQIRITNIADLLIFENYLYSKNECLGLYRKRIQFTYL